MSTKQHMKTIIQLFWHRRLAFIAAGALLLILQTAAVPSAFAAESVVTEYVAASFDPHEQVGHQHGSSGQEDGGVSIGQVLFYILRAVYYLVLLLAAGLMLWTVALPISENNIQRKLAGKWSLMAIRALMLVALLYVFVQINSLLQGYEGESSNEWLRLLTETTVGRSMLGLLVLAALAFLVLRLNDIVKVVWALLVLGMESFNGHVNALPSNTLAILLDFVHLICSALWAGGLILLLLFWRNERKEAGRFAEKFAGVAWLAIAGLAASGIGIAIMLLPSWRYLIYTSWGLLLLAKSVLVVLVIVTGYLLRRRVKRRELPQGRLLMLDGALMGAIVIIVGIFTYVSPAPDTEPFYYHKMGEKLHYTLQISPNGPGPNRVTVKVWLPEQLGAPASVQLRLKSDKYPDREVIEPALLSEPADKTFTFPGFIETDYYADKVELYTSGDWTAELVITDMAGGITEAVIPFRN